MSTEESQLTPEEVAEAAKAVVQRQAERVEQSKGHVSRPSATQLAVDEETRSKSAAREEQNVQHAEALRKLHSASGNAFARQGMNAQDIVKAVAFLRDDVPWPKVMKLMPEVSVKALESWRPELERRAALPLGGERMLLGASKAKEG